MEENKTMETQEVNTERKELSYDELRNVAAQLQQENMQFRRLLGELNYNNFFNVNKPYYTTFVVNGIGSENGKANSDKIFDTLEFTADLINANTNKICDYSNNS